MKTLFALLISALISQGAYAQSLNGGTGRLGNFTQQKKTAFPSVKDLEKAKIYSREARKRTGAGRKGRGWVSGGPGSWLQGGHR